MWEFIIPNAIIAFSYVVIPVALGLLMLLNPHLPHQWLSILFIVFIVACGLTHAVHVMEYLHGSVHQPAYAAILSDWFCAVVSLATAVAMAVYIRQLHGFLIMVKHAK